MCDISRGKGHSMTTLCPLLLLSRDDENITSEPPALLTRYLWSKHIKATGHHILSHFLILSALFPYPFPKQGDTEVNFFLSKGLELGGPMVVHDKSEVCVHSHGNEDAALQYPLPAGREDTAPTSSLDLLTLLTCTSHSSDDHPRRTASVF